METKEAMEIIDAMEMCGGPSVSVELFKIFDLKYSIPGLDVTVVKKSSSCPILVILYASMGLHRYNLLKGTNFELRRITKYVKSTQTPPSSYYITLDAKEEPASSSSPPHTTFQILVSEEDVGIFPLSCDVARIRGEPSDDDDRETTSVYIPGESCCFLVGKDLPEWPPENPFEKYCLVNERDLQEKDKDWIHLYLELAVARSDWFYRKVPTDYSDLELVDCIAIDGEGLNAKNATFYIRFRDLFRARLGHNDDVDRVAIVRRRFDEKTGLFSLEGQILSSQVIPNKKAA